MDHDGLLGPARCRAQPDPNGCQYHDPGAHGYSLAFPNPNAG